MLSTKSMERDADRQVVSKMVLEAAHNKAELEAQRESLAKLTHQVSSLERELDQVLCVLSLHMSPAYQLPTAQ